MMTCQEGRGLNREDNEDDEREGEREDLLSPCARGRVRGRGAWLAGLGETPAPAAPAGVVVVVAAATEEEEGILRTGPLDTTTHSGQTHT